MILITGRTADGDYVVSDPAGDYYASSTGHYGDGKCGNNVVYPKAGLEVNANGRPALAIPSRPGADPRVLVVVGHAPSGERGNFGFPLEDESGRRAGLLASGGTVEGIPGSWVGVDPILPSDPDAPAVEPDPDSWPYAIVLPRPAEGLVLRVQGDEAAQFEIEVHAVENGLPSLATTEAGSLAAGETQTIALDVTAPATRIAAPRGKVKLRGKLRFRGTASDDGAGNEQVAFAKGRSLVGFKLL